MKKRNEIWLIEDETYLQDLFSRPPVMRDRDEAGMKNGNHHSRNFSQISESMVTFGWFDGEGMENNGIVTIPIVGELFDEPSCYGPDYKTIAECIESCETSEKVKAIVLDINGPGGMMSGLFEFCEVIRNCTKPIYAYVGGSACSADYAIAASCRKIFATPTSKVGSVGALYYFFDYSQAYKEHGIEEVIITAKNSEKKVIDPMTEQGRKVFQERIDKAEEFLINHIAQCRGITPEDVLANFGHGDVFYSSEALAKGMVDVLVTGLDELIEKIPSQIEGEERGEFSMTKEEFREKNPEVYASIVADAKAEAQKEFDERMRGETEKAVAAELVRREGLERFNAVDDPEVKAMVAKAIEDKTSVEQFSASVALKLLEIQGRAKASVPQQPPTETNSLKDEAEESAKNTPVVKAAVPTGNDPFAAVIRESNEVIAAMDKANKEGK